ncbi:hypothetical protein ACFL6X_06855 [Candidatus Latescibacterota bacterium]
MMDVDTQRQLFFDRRFIDSSTGVSLRMNAPVQHPEPVLVADRPWESHGIGAYNTVMLEPDGRFRMWYDAGVKGGLPSEGARRLGYAESEDGLHWTKPSLGLIEFAGSRDNNLVAPPLERQSLQGATVMVDERAPAEARYKGWTKFRPTDDELAAGAEAGLWAMQSPDGIHWTLSEGQPNPAGESCDTQNMLFWDDRLELYVGYIRVRQTQHRDEAAEAAGRGRYRSVGRITSPDFRSWTPLEIVFQADVQDLAMPVPFQREDPRPNIDYYTSCAMKYPWAQDAYVMLPSAYYHWGENDYPATMDVHLLTSRDGIRWERAGEREPFLRAGADGGPQSGMLFANPWLIPMGDELWLYYSATAKTHGPPPPGSRKAQEGRSSGGIYRSSLRRDGFVSADAGYAGGELVTPEVTFGGTQLELNFEGSAGGWIQVEILDSNGVPLPGFGLAQADAARGNGVSKPVSWQGAADVSALAGKPVRLRFVMRSVKLYAFQFC